MTEPVQVVRHAARWRNYWPREEATADFYRLLAEVQAAIDAHDPDYARCRAVLSAGIAFYRNPSLRDWSFYIDRARAQGNPQLVEALEHDAAYRDWDGDHWEHLSDRSDICLPVSVDVEVRQQSQSQSQRPTP